MNKEEVKEEKANIKALEDIEAKSVGKSMQHLFNAGYYHGIKVEKEERLKKETVYKMDEQAQRDIWKLKQIRETLEMYKKGHYGDDEAIATHAALSNIISIAKEEE